jgi:lysozyme family protein
MTQQERVRMSTFSEASQRLRGHDDGFTQDRRDASHWTGGQVGNGVCKGAKFGVAAADYPDEDIERLTIERARLLHQRDCWGPAGCDAVPPALRLELFEMSVECGVRTVIRMLQRACGEPADGVLGAQTLQALQSMPPALLVARFNGERLAYLAELHSWPAHGRAWARRIAASLKAA